MSLPGEPRDLQFPLDLAVVLENETPDEPVGGRPVFPEDGEEKIIVPVEISADWFTILASTVDVGRDPAYPDQSQFVWWLWNRIWLTMSLCEAVAQCLIDENEALIDALAAALANNLQLRNAISDALSENGGATPGLPLSEESAETDRLPDNVRDEEGDCIPDNLWGGCLYLVQSGNRAISDFFEVLEAASNTLEASAIIAQAIPGVGPYAAAAGQFADQMQENIAEGYAAAYTEEYEQSLACDLFCLALGDCALSIDQMIVTLNGRLSSPIDIGDMGEIMVGIASGTWVGDEIADVAFLVYFSAIRFGQQFADKIGIRPLTDLMSLGADQLASDNWSVLCDCPGLWGHEFDLTETDGGLIVSVEVPPFDGGAWISGTGWVSTFEVDNDILSLTRVLPVQADTVISQISLWWTAAENLNNAAIYQGSFPGNNLPAAAGTYEGVGVVMSIDLSIAQSVKLRLDGGTSGPTVILTKIRFSGAGFDPF